MPEKKKITVTPNTEFSLKVLEDAVKDLPDGEKKLQAEKAVMYLIRAAQGSQGTQSSKDSCPPDKDVWP